jgi:hypothetical protein
MDLEDICRIGAPLGMHPNAASYILTQAQAALPGHEPSAETLSQWMVHLRNTGGAYLFPAPVQAYTPAPDYATLPPSERLSRWRADHPPTSKHPAVTLTPAQMKGLEVLSPVARITEARRLAGAQVQKE